MSKVVGIDLGTTNSCIVVMEGGTAQVIPNQEGARTTPSIVAFTSKGERLVGQIAKRQALTNPQNTIYGVKRLLGRRFNSPEVQSASKVLPYQIIESTNGDAHIQVDDKVYSPPEISAIVLQKLKAAAEDYLGEPVEEAIITVPAYFNDSQRQATRDAGTIAGLKVLRILNEPTAASLAYGMNENKSGKIAVYDLGGGTFDISILELQDGIYQVLSTGGDTYLGGEDFDQYIMNWLVEEFQRENDIDLRGDRMALQRLKEAAEKAKCELSNQPQAEIVLPFISANQSGPKHLNTVLTRTKFEQMIQPLLDRTVRPCEDALSSAGLSRDEIDDVIPVGGQTRTPKVLETIKKIFGKEPTKSVNPDEVVSIGAAIQTGILKGEVTDLVLLDVTPHTLGIETKDGTFTPLIERNSNIPTKKGRTFTTVTDNQTKVEVHVLQGEGSLAHENTSLGRFMLTDVAPAPRGVPQIEVTFEIDVNGIVQVTALDQATGRQQNITVKAGSGLTQSQVEKARTEAERQAKLEETLREREKVSGQLQGLIHSTRKTYQLLQTKLTDEERQQATQALDRAEQTREGSLEDLQSALANLETTAEALGQAMLRG
ncbi:MAG TPA: molecular chaperone DnaK [Vicinamibacteria bacterium]|nr:molecular chaperone DnaK [Vicinamibacteria bacterium]